MKRKLCDATDSNRKRIKLDIALDKQNCNEEYKCICKKPLTKVQDGSKLYQHDELGGAVCDICNVFAQNNQVYWHCNIVKNNIHNHGFDICDMCINIKSQVKNKSNSNEIVCVDKNICNCHHLSQFIFIMDQYNKSAENNKRNMQTNVSTLLNHYLHFLEKHNDDTSFEIIGKKLSECNILNCSSFSRNYRNRNDLNDTFDNCVNEQIIDKIHCYYLHSFDIGHRLRSSERHSIENIDADDHKLTKEKQNENKENSFDEQYLLNNKLINMNKVLTERQTKDKYKNVNQRIGIKYNQLFEKKEEHTQNSSDTDRKYGLGFKFKYGYYGEKQTHNIMTKARHSSLKEELISNDLSNITIHQFDAEYRKAMMHHDSIYCRQKFVTFKDKCDIKWIFLLHHLLSLMIYCNYTELQYEFSKTYRENNGNHNNFYYVGVYIKIAIKMFGTEIKDGTIDAFYHGIGQKLLFPAYIGTYWYPDYGGLIINCPLSTSSSYLVATRFTNNNNGIIIQFGDTKLWACSAKYFSVSWLSDYGSESEYLFVENEWALQIINIYDTNLGFQYRFILKSLRIISGITGNNKPYNEEITPKMQGLILKIFTHHLSDIKSLDSMCEYAQKLIDIYFQNQKEITINYCTIKDEKYSFLFTIFAHSKCEWIKLNELTKLFPNVLHLQITNVNFSEEILRYICDYFSTKTTVDNSILSEILIDLNETYESEDNLSIFDAIRKYKDQLSTNGVSITIHDGKQLIVKQTKKQNRLHMDAKHHTFVFKRSPNISKDCVLAVQNSEFD